MLIRTNSRLYDTDKARFIEVFEHSYMSFGASLDLVFGWLEREGHHDSSAIYSGTVNECREKLDQIQEAILKGEKLFVIEGDGTKQEKAEANERALIRELNESDEIEIPF